MTTTMTKPVATDRDGDDHDEQYGLLYDQLEQLLDPEHRDVLLELDSVVGRGSGPNAPPVVTN